MTLARFLCKCRIWAVLGIVWVLFLPKIAKGQEKDYNLKLGPVSFDLKASLRGEYNDNINFSGINPLEDIILGFDIKFPANWDISENTTLSLNLGIGYDKYLYHPRFDSRRNFLNISPDTEVAARILIKRVTIDFFERLSFSLDPSESVLIDQQTGQVRTDVQRFGRFHNTIGATADVDLNDIKWEFGARRDDIIPLEERFDFTRRTRYTLFTRPRAVVAPPMTVGVRAAYFFSQSPADIQNDSTGYSIGPFLNWQISRFLALSAEVNYQQLSFEESRRGRDVRSTTGVTGGVAVDHVLNSKLQHRFGYFRALNLGFVANARNANELRYHADWDVLNKTALDFEASYQWGEDSGGIRPEAFERFRFEVGATYSMMPEMDLRAFYAHTRNTSNIFGRSYTQNRFGASLTYDF